MRFFVSKTISLQLSIVIVNYRVKYFLEQCLFSVQKACIGLDAEIIVVDNHSSDGSREYLEPKFPTIKFKWLSENIGFGRANNSVTNDLRGEYVLYLNPDTLVPEDCFSKCLHFCETTGNCGALGVRMIDGSGRFLKESKRSIPSLRSSFFKMSGLASVFPRSKSFASYYAGNLPENETSKVDVIAGAFMMVKKEVLLKTGGFDEAFFMYAEDVDLSFRIQKEGYHNYYFPSVSIIHFKGESTQKLSPSYNRHFYGAMRLFIKKHHPAPTFHRRLMLLSVNAGLMLAEMKRRLQKASAQPNRTSTHLNTAVVGSQPEFNALLQLLKFAASPLMLLGRIGFAKNDTEAKIGQLQQMNETVRNKKIGQLIFCEGTLSFSEIIKEIQQVKKGISFMFHAAGSSSVVGSNEKNERGVFIAENTG